MKNISIVAVLLLSGCATSSGVAKMGEDTYLISRNGAGFWSSTAQVKAEALKDADAYCSKNGKKIQVIHTSQHEASGRPGDFPGAEVQFMCLNAGDQELSRPKLRKEADTVVEIKQEIKQEIKHTGSARQSKDIYQELLKLDDLRKKGILSEEEFKAEKTKLLNSH